MKKLLATSLAAVLLVPAVACAAERFDEKDFNWDDPLLNHYKRIVVAGVNKMAREKPDCAMLDPKSVQYEGGTPDDPGFIVTCGDSDHVTHAHFTKTDITGSPYSDVPLDEQENH
ncbi:MAG TPA: hypothetical protein VGE69_13450 [Pseudomonadales bacterium]